MLRHSDREGVHFDLMIECGDALATWKGTLAPESCTNQPWACRRIGDHRRAYLDYEGPVSGDRGEVRRHDRGICVVERAGDAALVVQFQGGILRGRHELVLRDPAAQGWSLSSIET